LRSGLGIGAAEAQASQRGRIGSSIGRDPDRLMQKRFSLAV
jgi:hypothetical protein